MAEPPPIIRIRCEGSEDECCSSGGEEVAAQWGLARNAPGPDKRHSAPEVRPGMVASGQLSRAWLAPQSHGGVHGGTRYSLPQLLARTPGEKRLSAPSCLAPPPHYPSSPASHCGSRRCSLDEFSSSPDDFWHYRRLCRLQRRRFSDTTRLDVHGKSPRPSPRTRPRPHHEFCVLIFVVLTCVLSLLQVEVKAPTCSG